MGWLKFNVPCVDNDRCGRNANCSGNGTGEWLVVVSRIYATSVHGGAKRTSTQRRIMAGGFNWSAQHHLIREDEEVALDGVTESAS